ncbi:MAG: D-alanyl-D-alanine carboxypeptidase [Candidatus Moranbacteria bacterium]|nr:D-alanyl-D-alanine carboxypeptidase [Candidatus Moranbacteria bacterium]
MNKKTKIFSVCFVVICAAFFYYEKAELFNFSQNKNDSECNAEVMGAHDISIEDIKEAKENSDVTLQKVFPVVDFQPVKREGVLDLVIPNAHAALVLDVDSGTILQYQNGKEIRQIASLTKMMTAVVVMENVKNLDEVVTIDEDARLIDGTRVGCPNSGYCIGTRLQMGEQISVRSLLKAMLMNSANDAATALGKHVGGTVDEFVDMMNKRAKELGLSDSNFCTPSGLEINGIEETCYSTAYDVARIVAHSMKYEVIWDILQISEDTIYSVDGKYSHDLRTTNKVLGKMPNCLGAKTGFTPLAGQSLIMGIEDEKSGRKIVAVILDDPYRWEDVQEMAEWTFNAYEWK